MCQENNPNNSIQIHIQGRVQGVGFRPFIYHLATKHSLSGSVSNTANGVEINLSGKSSQLKAFQRELSSSTPAAAYIEEVKYKHLDTLLNTQSFHILESKSESNNNGLPEISPDLAICSSCITELFTSDNPRYLHPFITCTQCGPRYSLISDLPYDRRNTSMAKFAMCPSCNEEYETPSNKRFHSQTNACHHCGPSLSLLDSSGNQIELEKIHNEIDFCAEHIQKGDIIAIKGIGGFHLICDASNTKTIKRLRKLKARPDKPFALMALNSTSFKPLVKLDRSSIEVLESPKAPIVLIPKKDTFDKHLAPGLNDLGCMLPYTAIHYLLFHALLGKPAGTEWLNQEHPIHLIVTSANLPGEPILFDNQQCMEQAAQLADYVLLHDRDIIAPSDDSIIQSGQPGTLIRRSRGFAPASIPLTKKGQNVLACGAHLKNTFCLSMSNKAYLSPYIGELNSPAHIKRYQDTISHYQHLFGQDQKIYSTDLHPDYVSTHYAESTSKKRDLPLVSIQHHHAHLASLLAEQDELSKQPVLGLVLDGNGLGDDNKAWGGELFFADKSGFKRIGHLEEIALPGGDIATREIWRIGASLLVKNHQELALEMFSRELQKPLTQSFIFNGKHPLTSSAGRWFDAIASILKLRQNCSYEGQAAAELEAIASVSIAQSLIEIDKNNRLVLSTILPHLLKAKSQSAAASLFHTELVDALVRWLEKAATTYQTKNICCSGGCFQNRVLRESLNNTLSSVGYKIYFNKKVPSNDGGISLGQAYLSR